MDGGDYGIDDSMGRDHSVDRAVALNTRYTGLIRCNIIWSQVFILRFLIVIKAW